MANLKMIKSVSIILVGAAAIVVGFQNCGNGFESASNTLSSLLENPSNGAPNLGGPAVKMKTIAAAGTGKTCYLNENNLVLCGGGIYVSEIPTPVANLGPVKSFSYWSTAGHGCALTLQDTVKCWGRNENGQLGLGTYAEALEAFEVAGLTGIKSVVTGDSHSCVITATDTVKCWGFGVIPDPNGQNGGFGTPNTPVDIPGLTNIRSLSAGDRGTTCALDNIGDLRCWQVNPPNLVEAMGVKASSQGRDFICVITAQDTVKCRGTNDLGQLGNNTNVFSSTYVDVVNLTNVKSISSGYTHTCAVTAQNQVKCWGDNGFNVNSANLGGKLGNNSKISFSSSPVDVLNLSNVASVSAGQNHTCAINLSNEAYCWGNGGLGSLGNNSVTSSYNPIDTPRLSGFKTLVGRCGLTEQNTFRCLEDSTSSATPVPVELLSLVGLKDFDSSYDFGCVITAQNTVKCWGSGFTGLADIVGLTGVQYLSASFASICALDNTASVKCWGQFQGNTAANAQTPMEVLAFKGAKSLASNQLSRCAQMADDTVKCWGEYGGIGDIQAAPVGLTNPVLVPNLTGVKKIVGNAMGSHICAITLQNTLKCWGDNSRGQLGLGNIVQPSPAMARDVAGLNDIQSIAIGSSHTCSLSNQGAVYCWGNNQSGQIGTGVSLTNSTPVRPVLTDKKIKSISASGSSSYFFFENGTAAFTGQGLSGSLVPVGPIRGPI